MIEIIRPGGLTTVQDLGRTGFAHLGVGRSGAADRGALRLANALVGNAADAAGLELTLGGLSFRALDAATIALTGAPCPGPVDWNVAVSIPAGTVVSLAAPGTGLRSYLAVRGGLDVPPVLGSRSADVLAGLGPDVLRAGDRLPIGDRTAAEVSGAVATPAASTRALRVVRGPRDDWFTPASVAGLTRVRWQVGPASNRIGLRLAGPSVVWARTDELPTEATRPGALQVPPDGQPILLGPDAPVTGGYPVVAVVVDDDLDRVGQLRPGDSVRFRAD